MKRSFRLSMLALALAITAGGAMADTKVANRTSDVTGANATPDAVLEVVGATTNTKPTFMVRSIDNDDASTSLTVKQGAAGAPGNVGIGTTAPVSGASLELKSASKALLLTRVADVTAVANPVDGMIVYDISLKCVRSYENGVWSPCLSASSGGGSGGAPTYPWETEIRFKQISNSYLNAGNSYMSGGASVDGNAYFWGRDYYGSIDYDTVWNADAAQKSSPVIMNGAWNGKVVKAMTGGDAFYILDTDGNIWSWGSQSEGQLGDGVNGGGITVRRTPAISINKPAGVTKFVDFSNRSRGLYVLGDNGKVYFAGGSNWLPWGATPNLTALPNPAGAAAGFKYSKIWQGNELGNTIFMLGSDGNIYSAGPLKGLTGNAAVATGAATITQNATIVKMNLPAGEGVKVTKIDSNDTFSLVLTSEGKVYGMGQVGFDYGVTNNTYTYSNFKPVDPAAVTTVQNQYGHRSYFSYNPVLVKLPEGETGFTDINAGGSTVTYVTASGKAYALGVETYENESGTMENINKRVFNDYVLVEALSGITPVSVISTREGTQVLDAKGKVWGYGVNRYCMIGGNNCPVNIPIAMPLLNGNRDINNPRPRAIN